MPEHKFAEIKPQVKAFFASIESFVNELSTTDPEKVELYRSISQFAKCHADLISMPVDYDKIVSSLKEYLKIYE